MAEARQIFFNFEEIAEALVKRQGIHEGLWGVYVEFAIAAANIDATPTGDLVPAAIVPIKRMGLQKFDEEVKGLTVNAALVNPSPETATP